MLKGACSSALSDVDHNKECEHATHVHCWDPSEHMEVGDPR